MKALLIVSIAVFSFVTFANELTPTNVVRMTKKQFTELVEKNGGFVTKPATGLGCILFANAQKRVPIDQMSAPVEYLKKYTKLPIQLKDTPDFGSEFSRDIVRQNKANMMIAIIDNKASGSPLLISPDEAWATVNIAALATDNPKPDILAFRLRKEMSRAFAFLCGGVNTQYKLTPVNSCASLRDLDRIDMDEVPADLIQRFKTYVDGYGVTPYIIATYKSACRKGWAPTPTNDVQKAIWAEINADKERGPKNAIQIKP